MGVKDIIYCLIFLFYIFITLKIIFLPYLIKVLQSDGEHREGQIRLKHGSTNDHRLFSLPSMSQSVSFIAAT